MPISAHNIALFKDVRKEDVSIVGGKAANLGEMESAGFPVPDGFVITATAYYDFLRENNLSLKIRHLLSSANLSDQKSLHHTSENIKKLILTASIPKHLIDEILLSYKNLGGENIFVAVRSSATAEDLSYASFAGQQETFLNVKGDAVLLDAVKKGWASLFNARAIFYRHEHKLDHAKVGIALAIQEMVESEKSGVMFTTDPVTSDKTKIIIEAIFGLGELIVQGEVTPDHYEIDKNTLEITSKKISVQDYILVKGSTGNKKMKLSKEKGDVQKITVEQIKQLASLGKDIEKHYYFPQDIEWAIEKNKIYIVQTRPVTTTSKLSRLPKPGTGGQANIKNKKEDKISFGQLLLKGDPASPGVASGPVKIIKGLSEISKISSGDILVARETNPDFVPAMRIASAIVTDSGGRTSHAAIVSRELGIPAVVGTQNATSVLKNLEFVTVDGAKGEIYEGDVYVKSKAKAIFHSELKTATKLYVNLAEPSLAYEVSQRNVDGVGLLRAEFMMAEIGVHPKKMIKEGKAKEYVEKLSDGLVVFCKAFEGKPVVYRTSDFKTNEYRNLLGGKDYEPVEANPMLGYRGAFRYIHDSDVFKLELEAIKRVRNKLDLKNLWIMIPFVRTVEELEKVKKIINDFGLERSPNFQLWMMVEIPSNVLLLDKFINVGIDGISIGSNDLTMLLLGTDRDNAEVANEFDERNQAALWAFEHTIKTTHKFGITSSFCGQAVSLFPDLVKNVVEWGITSISVSPDAIDITRSLLAAAEKELLRR